MSRVPDGVGAAQRRNASPGRCGLPGNKGQRRKPYPSTPCWSCLPRFLRTGSRPRDYVSSGGHGRWRAGSHTSKPARTLTFPDMAPWPPLLWGVQHGEGWEETQTLSSRSTATASLARGEARAHHKREVPARETNGEPSPPPSKQLSDEPHSPRNKRPCSARLLPRQISFSCLENSFQSISLGVFSFGPT